MDLNCPYCDAELEVNHDDGRGYQEDVKHEMQCPKCEKSFVFTTAISYSYEAQKADCLNDGKCDFQLSHTSPNEFSTMICSMCDAVRELTDEERKTFGIGTKESYFEMLEDKKTVRNYFYE